MMYGNEGQFLVKCPYNPAHIIRSFRFPYHINRCRKNHPNVKLENCWYNFGHLMKSEDILKHMEICPYKLKIETNLCSNASVEDKLCKNDYDDGFDKEIDDGEDNFRLIPPLKKESKISPNEKSSYIILQKKCNDTKSVKESEINSEFNEFFDEDDELPPLQLPKTKSRAFQIKHSLSLDVSIDESLKSISKHCTGSFLLDDKDKVSYSDQSVQQENILEIN